MRWDWEDLKAEIIADENMGREEVVTLLAKHTDIITNEESALVVAARELRAAEEKFLGLFTEAMLK